MLLGAGSKDLLHPCAGEGFVFWGVHARCWSPAVLSTLCLEEAICALCAPMAHFGGGLVVRRLSSTMDCSGGCWLVAHAMENRLMGGCVSSEIG